MTRHAVDHKTNAARPPSEDKHRVLTTHSTTLSVTEWYGENIRKLMLYLPIDGLNFSRLWAQSVDIYAKCIHVEYYTFLCL